ncbi:GNAT family N-acetyltransferase [Salsipaludibacter albus]|uniref:GNAT family N-acetyltransferase n=1 Tax=Salsipaludibacter albus TaxID=2849650 RepID=UPI001EE4BCF4|nr:GNAT family N-acetyltransferase [Salsipaludibacter albus]MBY5162961.1 GNAT family N-acetyltransferase [Salsipaludibacter albus]
MVEVRRVAADDPAVVDLLAAHVALMDAGPEPAEAKHRLEPDALADPALTLLAAFDDGEVVAIGAYAARGDDWGEVKSMHVAADHRGRGLGRTMLAALEDEARRHGATHVRLETGATMAAALALYLGAGYTPRAPFGHYPEHPASIFLEKALPPHP